MSFWLFGFKDETWSFSTDGRNVTTLGFRPPARDEFFTRLLKDTEPL